MEDLLLEFTNGVFHFLPSRHHVAEVSNLQKHKERRSFRQGSKEVPRSCAAASAPEVSILSSRPHQGCTSSYWGSPVMARPWERAESTAAVAANLSDLRSNLSAEPCQCLGGRRRSGGTSPQAAPICGVGTASPPCRGCSAGPLPLCCWLLHKLGLRPPSCRPLGASCALRAPSQHPEHPHVGREKLFCRFVLFCFVFSPNPLAVNTEKRATRCLFYYVLFFLLLFWMEENIQPKFL